VVGIPAKPVPVDIETAEPREFLPYGTPCNEIADPILARLCELEREIKQLRDEAKAELGAKYDLKAFDDAVVLGGNVPMDVLAMNVGDYIARTKAA